MESLKQIIKIASKRRLKNLEVIDSKILADKNNLYHKFYNGVNSGQFSSDQDASSYFYSAKPTDPRYRKLKSRFKNRLYNSVIFFDSENQKVSSYQRMYYRNYRDFISLMFVIKNGGRQVIVKDALKLLKTVSKYEFYDISILLSQLLMEYYSIINDHSKFSKIRDKNIEFMEKFSLQNESKELSFLSDLIAKNSKLNVNIKLKELMDIFNKIVKISKKSNCNIIANNRFNCAIQYFTQLRDYKRLLCSIAEYESYLLQNTLFSTKNKIAKLSFFKLLAYLHQSEFKKGSECVEMVDGIVTIGTNNWALFKEYHYLLSIKTERYYQAFDVLHTVTSHPRFNTTLSNQKERWRIFEAYLEWVIVNNKGLNERIATFRIDKGQKPDKTFRLAKFLNDVPTYEKDKRGLNVAIIIIGILWNLKRENFNPIIDKQDSLKTYAQRYLKEDDSYRSKMFLYMLITMIKKSFNYEKTKRLSKKYFDKLKTKDMHYQGGSIDLEIVPYEKLWPMVLKLLKEHEGK